MAVIVQREIPQKEDPIITEAWCLHDLPLPSGVFMICRFVHYKLSTNGELSVVKLFVRLKLEPNPVKALKFF